MPDFSRECALLVSFNSSETIDRCLASLPAEIEVVLVDNASTDGTVALAREKFPFAKVIESEKNLGFAVGCNLAASQAGKGKDILLLNPDSVLDEKGLEKLMLFLEKHPSCGAVGPRVLDPEEKIELSWGRFPSILVEWKRKKEHRKGAIKTFQSAEPVDWVSGACILVRREAWDKIGGFDENFFLYFEDLDLCARLKKEGWSVFYEPSAILHHERGHSSRKNLDQVGVWYRESQLRYYSKHLPFYERLFLRLYLTAKFFFPALAKAGPARSILKSALGPFGPGSAKS